jgi:hypothetical protein
MRSLRARFVFACFARFFSVLLACLWLCEFFLVPLPSFVLVLLVFACLACPLVSLWLRRHPTGIE